MAFMTYGELLGRGVLTEDMTVKTAAQLGVSKDVFLAHSSADRAFIRGTLDFFRDYGASVYVDKADGTLPVTTSTVTAQKLVERIRACRRMVVMVSDRTHASHWVPWELGLAHGQKNSVVRIALLPVSETRQEKSWVRQEYLGLYTRIVYEHLANRRSPCWAVYDPRDNKYWPLVAWLHNAVA